MSEHDAGPAAPTEPKKTSTGQKIIGVIVAILLLGWVLSLFGVGDSDLRGMTCDQLTVEMLKMTGPSANEEYDLDRVRAINDERKRLGTCWP